MRCKFVKKLPEIICLLILIGLIPNLASAQIPQWYLDGKSNQYQPPTYIVGVGEAGNQQEAQNLARAGVASQIRVQVESEITSITQEMQVDDQYTYESMFRNATTSRIEESIQGLQMVKQTEHANMHYAMAALNKESYLLNIRTDLDRLKEEYDRLVGTGKNEISSGNIFAGITNYLDAQSKSTEFYALMSTYNALSEIPYGAGDELGLADMVTEIRGVLTSISVSVASGDAQTGQRGRQLPEPIVFEAIYTQNGQEIPIANLPLIIEYQDGTEADRVTTSTDGRASVALTALPVRQETNRVTAKPVFSSIPATYRNVVRTLEARGTYNLEAEERVPFAVIIKDEDGNRQSTVEQRVASNIERLGYSISDDAELVVEGTISIRDYEEVSGMSGTQIVARVQLDLFVKNRTTNTTIGSISGDGTGMSSRGEADALRASFNRINVNRRDLSEVLASASGE